MYLIRKISRAKWESNSSLLPEEIGADAITGCLRTFNNSLSVWQCGQVQREEDIKEAILALAASMERIDKIDVVIIDKSALEEKGIALEPTPGNTPVEDLRDKHLDIIRLDTSRLCLIAQYIAEKIRRNTKKIRSKIIIYDFWTLTLISKFIIHNL